MAGCKSTKLGGRLFTLFGIFARDTAATELSDYPGFEQEFWRGSTPEARPKNGGRGRRSLPRREFALGTPCARSEERDNIEDGGGSAEIHMNKKMRLVLSLASLAGCVAALAPGALVQSARAQSADPGIDQTLPGQALPKDKAESINGKSFDFPAMMRGSVAACIFGFGNNSADRVGVWLENLWSDGVNAWSVVNLETIPSGVARTALRVAMRKGTPKNLYERSLVISKDATEWKRILGSQRESLPVVALFDKSGALVWKREGTFSSSIADELKAKIAEFSAKK